jgi:HAD superfamily hydrolase (TIGR01509 family)
MPEIDFIYFDLGKVILDFDHDRGCRQVSSIADVSPEQVKKTIFDSGLQNQYETGLVTCDEFHATFCQETGSRLGKLDLLTALSDIFEPNPGILPLIAQLTAVGFPIGILSNTCQAHWDLVYRRYTILRQCFEPVILSFEINSMKPDSKIYERAIELAGCRVESCFFMDDKQDNVDGAKAVGIDALLYQSVPHLLEALVARGVSINL